MKNFEKLLIEHCSPTLAGVKAANLFRYMEDNESDIVETVDYWNDKLMPRGLRIKILKSKPGSRGALIYIFRISWLEKVLKENEVRSFLLNNGYEDYGDVDLYLEKLSQGIIESDVFPHEIGVFLGYPLKDVKSFIENKGSNYKFCGVWKVYHDPHEAERSFARYEKCKNIYKELYKQGRSIIRLTVAA